MNWSRIVAATLIGLSGLVSRAQTDEEVSALLAEALLLPDWETLFTATAGLGYKDNVFLASTDPQSSPFVSAAGELFILRLAPLGPRVTVFGNADARYYFAGDVMHEEVTSFNQASIEGALTDTLQGSVAARYFYQDQVLDVSVTETNRQPTPVLGHTFMIEPGLRWEWPRDFWLSLTTPATRQFFEEPLDDYWQVGAVLTVGRGYRWDSQFALSYEPEWRPYDSDPARTAEGVAIPGSRREAFQQDAVLVWRHHWDEEQRWRTEFTLGGRLNLENGGGFSDYWRGRVSARLRYASGPWEVSAEGRVAHFDYRNQTVSVTSDEKRERTELGTLLELQRRLSTRLTWRVAYEYENIQSNDPLEGYDVNTVSTAFAFEF